MSGVPRATRSEQKARTRTELLAAAARTLSERGVQGASVDQIAAAAGYTKGAFYASFESKDALLLAMLDERFAERIRVFDELLAGDASLEEQAREGGTEFSHYVGGDRDWERLFFEFAVHAARDDSFRAELVARYRGLVDRLAQALARRAEAAGMEPSLDAHVLALMVFVAANGVALQQLLDPDGVPEELLGRMLELIARGALA